MSGRPYAEVIGDPIAHSKSPTIHNFWLSKLGIDAEYRACHVRAGELDAYFTRRRADPAWRGCNITLPHKVAALSHVFHVDPVAQRIGAINTVRRSGWEIIGFNTDTDGICQALYEGGEPKAEKVCLIGTGGAARAAMSELKDFGVKHVNVVCRSLDRGKKLLQDFKQKGSVTSFEQAAVALTDADYLVNASSLGMSGQAPMPVTVIDSLRFMHSDAFLFDMVYTPLETALVRAAHANGLRTVDGLVMLLNQASRAFDEIFKPVRRPNPDDPELRALLTA